MFSLVEFSEVLRTLAKLRPIKFNQVSCILVWLYNVVSIYVLYDLLTLIGVFIY